MDETRRKQDEFVKLPSKCGTTEDVYYSLSYKDLPHDFKVYARTELNETEDNKTKGLRKLRDFLKKQNMPDVDDDTLILVLRNCKYNFKKAETKLKTFVEIRSMLFRKAAELDLERVEKILDSMCFGYLPYTDKHGRVIFYTRPVMDSEVNDNFEDALVVVSTTGIILYQSSPMTSVAGITYIASGKDFSITTHYPLSKVFGRFVKTQLHIPVRIARVDIVHENFLQRLLYNIVYPFLTSKIRKRIFCHGSNLETLQQFYHPDILPDEFGGNMGPLSTRHYKEEILNFIKRLKAEYKT